MKQPAEFNFVDPAVQSEPVEFFASLRAHAPVYREPYTGAYFVSRAEDICAVAQQPETFSNYVDPSVFRICQGPALERLDPEVAAILKAKAWLVPSTLLLTDPPVHARYRRLAMEVLSPKAVAELQPSIRSLVERYIVAFDSGEDTDFLAEFAEKLPLSVILRFFGAPDEDRTKVNRWTHQFFSTLMGQSSREDYLRTVDAVCEMFQYIAARTEDVRRHPDDSLLNALLHAHEATGDEPLTLEEILSFFQVLLLAGHDTTRQTLTNAMRFLATDRDLCARLRATRELIKPFIDEVVRLTSPANVTARYAVKDAEIGGVRIPKNSTVFLCWGSGNRDPAKFADPDRFECPRKGGGAHLGFGYGIHLCAGMRLAKAQISLTIEAMLDRYSDIRLAVPDSSLTYEPAINLRALTSLPIRCTRATGGH
jgi:cytochrome P450